MVGERAGIRRGSVARDDPRDHTSAEIRVGDTGHSGLGDRRVLEQGGLDLRGIHVLAAGLMRSSRRSRT